MNKPRRDYTVLFLLILVWVAFLIQELENILGSDPVVFPRPKINGLRFVITGLILSLFSLKIGLKDMWKAQKEKGLHKKLLFYSLIIFTVLIPLCYAYVFEQDTQGFSQSILNLSGLMDEDFDELPPGIDPPGWDPEDGNWTTVNDNGNIVYYQEDNADKNVLSIFIPGNTSWTDYTYEVDVKFVEGNTKKDDRGVFILFRYQRKNRYYFLYMKEHLDLLELHDQGD